MRLEAAHLDKVELGSNTAGPPVLSGLAVLYTTYHEDQELKDRLASKDFDEHIFSAGFGIVLFDILQVDVAASYGELITEGTLSVVYRF